VRRENQDANKGALGIGLGFRPHYRVALDVAFETLLPLGPTNRVVAVQGPDNEAGTYAARVYSIELAGTIFF
jgi:hypothetical protein